MRAGLPFLLAAGTLSACGGGDASAPARGLVEAPRTIADHGAGEVQGRRLVVRLGDDYFAPTVVRGQRGATVTLVLENVGRVAHAFDVAAAGQKVDVIVQPGERRSVEVTLPRTGRVLFFCKFHWSRGMAGFLEPARTR